MIHEAYMPVYMGSRFLARDGRDGTGRTEVVQEALADLKIDFWPQIFKFWGQKSTFLSLAANWSLTDQCFQHKKGVSLDS